MNSNHGKEALMSGIWYTVSNFLVKSIGFITTPIFTRLLSKSEYGLYNNYISWMSIITIFVTLNLDGTLISARYDYSEKFDEYIFSILSFSSLSTIIWYFVFEIFKDPISSFLGIDIIYIRVMLAYLLFLPAINLFQARERYYFEYKKTVFVSMLLSITTAILSVLFVVGFENRLSGRIFGAALPTILIGLYISIYIGIKGKSIHISYWKYALPVCLPYIPHLLSLTLLNTIDRVMINKFCGSEKTALYSLAYTCGTIINLLMTSINSAYAPWMGEKLNEDKYSEIRNFSRIYIKSFFLLAIGIMLVSPEILLILGGKSYVEARYVMTPVSMGCMCQFLYTMFVNIEQFKKRTIGMAFASVTAAVVNLILNWIFIPRIGYLAAAYTTLAGYICLLFIHMWFVYRIKMSDVYDYKFIGIAIIIGISIMISVTLLYSTDILRYAVIAGYCVMMCIVIYRNRNYIKKMLIKQL